MFKKNQRLSRPEFTEYFAKGERHHFTNYTIITSPHLSHKVSVVVGKKVAKSAVRRNALKRRIYAQLRELFHKHSISGVFIVLAKPSYNTLPRKQSNETLSQAVLTVNKKVT